MTNCKKCGAKLMKSMSTAQMKKKAVSKGKKTLSTVLLVLGAILFVAGVIVAFTDGSVRAAILGGFLFGLGIRLRKE